MKKLLKRALCTTLALCLLILSATCLMGISASADVGAVTGSTVVHVAKTTGTDTTFYLATSAGTISTGEVVDSSVRYSFDYYVVKGTTGYFTARNNNSFFKANSGNYEGIVNESTTGSSYLAKGTVGHLDVTMKAKSGKSANLYPGIGGATGTVYIWNVKAWVNGSEVTVAKITSANSYSTTTYDKVPFEKDAYDEYSSVSPAFRWTGATGQVAGTVTETFGGSNENTGHGWGSNALITSTYRTADSYIKMSFEYYNKADGETFSVRNHQIGDSANYVDVLENTNPGKADRYLGTGYGRMEFKSINYNNVSNVRAAIGNQKAAAADSLYIWNVKFEVYVDGVTNVTNLYTTKFDKFTATTYG